MHKHHRSRHVHAITNPAERTPLGSDPMSKPAALRALGEVVYAVRCGDIVKIGHTTDLAARCWGLRATEVLGFVIGGTYDDEQQLHARLIEHVHHGREWYYPTPGVLAVVNEMRERLGLEPVAA